MTEDFLHYVWQNILFSREGLQTTSGSAIELIKTGELNPNSGPDFFNAQIRIDNTLWAGNVEIHIHSSDWNLHKHSNDTAYNNVILHVVWEHDSEIIRENKQPLTTLELKKIVPRAVFEKYEELCFSDKRIPCENEAAKVNKMLWQSWIDRLVVERLERKTEKVLFKLNLTANDWEDVFYRTLLSNLGNPINGTPFERLADVLPFKIINKHCNDITPLEALLLGQAGFLEPNAKDEYMTKLHTDYTYLKHKLDLPPPIAKHEWKFSRMRPAHFPTLRLAQVAAILNKNTHLFRTVAETKDYNELLKIFTPPPSDYWKTHFNPGKSTTKHSGIMGVSTINMLIINAVVPVLFIYGKQIWNEEVSERALNLLRHIDAEQNSIINKWESIGIPASNAYDSQALLQLRKEYCDKRRCTHCLIGHQLMKVYKVESS
jgi:hypothetical protein